MPYCTTCGVELDATAPRCSNCGWQRVGVAPPPPAARTYASWGLRVVAALIDGLVLTVPFFVWRFATIQPELRPEAGRWLGPFGILLVILVPFVYGVVMHGRPAGQTVGKIVVRIRLVDVDQDRSIGYGRAAFREGVAFAFGLIPIAGLIDVLWPLWDPRKQTLHDKAARSVAIRSPVRGSRGR